MGAFAQIAAGVVLLSQPVLGSQLFGPAVPKPSQPGPRGISARDLNGDGRTDLLVSAGLDKVGLLLGDGTGGFGAPLPIAVSGAASVARAADLNGDGRLDLAYAILGASTLIPGKLVLRVGDGTGGFAAEVNLGSVIGPQQVAVVDWSGDSIADVAVLTNFPAGIKVFPGLGGGAFGNPQFHPLVHSPSSFAFGDLDRDGRLDAVVGYSSDLVSVILGSGAGGMAPPLDFTIAGSHVDVAVEDLDRDGFPDVAASVFSQTSPGVVTALGTGNGSLASPQLWPLPFAPWEIAAGDVSLDGIADLCTANPSGNSVSVLLGSAGGAFAPSVEFATGTTPFGIALAELDGDGHPDLATSDYDSNAVSFLHNNSATAAGLALFGAGTPGCSGKLGIAGGSKPQIGNLGFGYACSNAPASALGVVLAGNAADLAGSDPFALGLLLHVDPFGSTFLAALDVVTGSEGIGFAPSPLPNNPAIVGATYAAQAIFVENAKNGLGCSPALVHLVSSHGILVTIQP